MKLVSSYQGKMLMCEKSFSFFEKGKKYYCIYDNAQYFYIWCNSENFGVNEIKLHKDLKKNFLLSF